MRRALNPRETARRTLCIVATATAAVLPAGCVHYRTVEIDATSARQFRWTGKIRVTERSIPAEFLSPRWEWFEISRIELVGENDRSIVIHPIADLRGKKPYACVQSLGSPPDQYLVRLREQIPVCQRAWQCMRSLDNFPELPPGDEASHQAWDEVLSVYARVAGHIGNREFDKVSGTEVAFASAFLAMQLESTYELDYRTVVRVRIEDDSLLTVTVEDKDGNILHRYGPEELAVVEVENR